MIDSQIGSIVIEVDMVCRLGDVNSDLQKLVSTSPEVKTQNRHHKIGWKVQDGSVVGIKQVVASLQSRGFAGDRFGLEETEDGADLEGKSAQDLHSKVLTIGAEHNLKLDPQVVERLRNPGLWAYVTMYHIIFIFILGINVVFMALTAGRKC